jgi:hypothetical protein
MVWLLRSPLSRLVDRSVMLITVRGRRTGRMYTLPVQYAAVGHTIWVVPGDHERKTWWRNLVGETPVALLVRGGEIYGSAQVFTGRSDPAEVEQGLRTYLDRFPRVASRFGVTHEHGDIDGERLRDLVKRSVIVRIVLNTSRADDPGPRP